MAPLSAIGIGTSWSLQGLWAAPWLRDVARLDRASVVDHLSVMAFVVCASALFLGALTKSLRRRGVRTEWVLASTVGLSMGAQAALLLGCPLPSYLLWSLIAAAGAATVLSFAILTDYFPKEMSGRANAALNLLHVGMAFLLQTGFGFIIAQWPQSNEGYPAEAHRSAMVTVLGLQMIALVWFGVAARGRSSVSKGLLSPALSPRYARWRMVSVPLIFARTRREYGAVFHSTAWPFAAASSALVSLTLLASLLRATGQTAIPVLLVAQVSADLPGPWWAIDSDRALPLQTSKGNNLSDWKK
jgi:hypothetical protein